MRILIASCVLSCSFFAAPLNAQDPVYDLDEIREIYLTFHQPDWWTLLLGTNASGQDIEADLTYEGVTYPQIGIRVKGNTSALAPGRKKPFNISMDSFIADQRLHGYKTINLNNAYVDPTFTREVLTYELYRRYMPAPRTGWARLYMNGEYWGHYIMVEQINKDLLEDHYRDDDGVRYKGDDPNRIRLNSSTLKYLGPEPSDYFSAYHIKTPDHEEAWVTLVDLIDKLNHTELADFVVVMEEVLDVDRALWYMAVGNVIHNLDSYVGGGHNYYMYFDPVDGRMDMIPWDCNMSFGVFAGGGSAWRLPPDYRSGGNSRPLKANLFDIEEYRQLFYSHMRTILDDWYDWDRVVGPLNEKYQTLIRASVEEDPHRLYSMQDFDLGVQNDLRLGGYTIPGLKPLVERRREFLIHHRSLRAWPLVIEDVQYSSSPPRAGEFVSVRARVRLADDSGFDRLDESEHQTRRIREVVLRASHQGAFERIAMYDDGLHADGAPGDGVFGGAFRAQEPGETYRFYVQAINVAGTIALDPPDAEHSFYSIQVRHGPPPADIALNEFVADNDGGDWDEAGDNDDWVEIFNPTASAYDLSGHFLTDDLEDRDKWEFPAGTVVPPHGHLRVWCDDEEGEGPLHASFKLSKNGEELGLIHPENGLLDAVIFGEQSTDQSFARVPDGGRDWYYVWEPSGEETTLGPDRPAVRYDQRRLGAPDGFRMSFDGGVRVGETAIFGIAGGPSSGNAAFLVSFGAGYDQIDPYGSLCVDPAMMIVTRASLDTHGEATFSFTVSPSLVGMTLYVQALAQFLSNAVTVEFQP